MGGARELPPSGGEIGTPNSQNSAPRRLDINLAPQPVLKIEVFSKATLDSLMTFNILATTICAGIILRISTTSPEALGRGWIVLAGVMQTIGALTFFFLLVAYPQRILRKWRSPNEFPLPEQLILIGIIILSVANPYFSLWGTVSFWTTYQRTIESFGLLSKNATLDWSFGQEFIDDAGFSTVQLHAIIGGCTLYLFSCVLGILVGVLHHSLSEEESFYLMGIKTKDSDALGTTSETNLHRLSTNRFYLAPPGQTCGEYGDSHDDLLRLVRQRVEGSSLQRAKHYDAFLKFQTLDLLNILLTCILIVLKIIPSISLSFIPSVLPNVQVITVCRVCLHSLNSMHPYCKPGSISFTRAMWQIGISVLELGHLYILFRLYRRCGLSLTRVPYALWRGQIISFLFYKSLATSTIVIVLIMAALLASVPNVYFWVNRYDNENREPVADPLFQIGITGMNFGIYFTAYVLVKPTLTLAIAFLPADSDGLLGFFCGREEYLHACGNKELDKEENRANAMASPEPDESRPGLMRASSAKNKRLHFQSLWFRRNWNHEEDEFDQEEIRNAYIQLYDELVWDKQERPVYIMLESTVRNLINTLHISDEREWSGIDVLSRQASSKLTELWRERLCPATENEKPFLRQIRDVNVFVLESEMTMFNFSCASYYLGTEANPKTPEEESMLLEDQKYKYIKHIYDAPTDTHCLVAHSSDRLIFAFRGTVSEQNAKTDLNLGLIPWDVANDPNVVASIDCPEEDLISEKGMRAKVHEGFHKAYYNVREEILECVKEFAVSSGKPPGCQLRAVCCTGHSLGGALATLAAFDIALLIGNIVQRYRVAVSCTTFGSPRVGNFVFAKRFNALISTCHRFVNAKDFIPKTPVKNLLTKLTLKGYYHVGTLVLLSNDGALIINPSSIERHVRSGAYRNSPVAHTTRSYAFSFLCWNIRAHWREWKPNIWTISTERLDDVAYTKKSDVDPIILGRLREFMRADGYRYKLGDHHVRNRATQVEADCMDETAILLRDFENYLREESADDSKVAGVVQNIKSLIYRKDSSGSTSELETVASSDLDSLLKV
uniref:Fungal lipase-type domain-containing protein n=1 Tax=Mucochytrium quahogii TaxID=96639 RepID=A0A7S2W9E6_9STRA|mmetsp:Transcript_17116/g.37366  ORF Transcript_17116/g.37366 Transcript_17116/m.37366 type:complete len:1064 (+) Transcript_17116:283-3474(+)